MSRFLLYRFAQSAAFLCLASSVANAGLIYWKPGANTLTTSPSAANPPWNTSASWAGTQFTKTNSQMTLAITNSYNATLLKSVGWDVAVSTQGLTTGVGTGYDNNNPPNTIQPLTFKLPNGVSASGGMLQSLNTYFYWQTYKPQPAYESMVLTTSNIGLRITGVSAESICYSCTNSTADILTGLYTSHCHFVSPVGVTTFGGNDPPITQYYVFPVSVAADPNPADSQFDAPPADGNWTAQYVTTDALGNAMPLGGIEWTTDGAGLNPGDPFDWTLSMQGEAPDTDYLNETVDSSGNVFVLETECIPEPSSLALLLVAGVVGYGLRWVRRH